MTQERNQLLDATKGAIIYVVLGHSIHLYAGLDNRTALDLGIERFMTIMAEKSKWARLLFLGK